MAKKWTTSLALTLPLVAGSAGCSDKSAEEEFKAPDIQLNEGQRPIYEDLLEHAREIALKIGQAKNTLADDRAGQNGRALEQLEQTRQKLKTLKEDVAKQDPAIAVALVTWLEATRQAYDLDLKALSKRSGGIETVYGEHAYDWLDRRRGLDEVIGELQGIDRSVAR